MNKEQSIMWWANKVMRNRVLIIKYNSDVDDERNTTSYVRVLKLTTKEHCERIRKNGDQPQWGSIINMFRTTYWFIDGLGKRQKQNRRRYSEGGTCCLQKDIYKAVLSNWVIIIAKYSGGWTFELNLATQEEGYRRRLVVDKRKDLLSRTETFIDTGRP